MDIHEDRIDGFLVLRLKDGTMRIVSPTTTCKTNESVERVNYIAVLKRLN